MEGTERGGSLFLGFSQRKEDEEIPVDPCKSWSEPCEFCDKRLGAWSDASEELLAKVPQGPGLFQVALRMKGAVEVADLVLDAVDVNRAAYARHDAAKDRVADKKAKVTKAVIVCRWMPFKQADDKNVTTLCAHWFNNGTLPRFTKVWPGQDILRSTKTLSYSDRLQKWCYPKKDAFWRKPKTPLTRVVEMVEGCNWTSACQFCDVNFGKWRPVDVVLQDGLVPEEAVGIYLLAVCWGGGNREVVEVCHNEHDVKLNIASHLAEYYQKSMLYALRNKKFVNKNASFQVRWAEMRDEKSNNSCYYYAHFLNAGTLPMSNFHLPGEKILDKNKNFVLRTADKKWCYEAECFKQIRATKTSSKKRIADELAEDVRNLHMEPEEED